MKFINKNIIIKYIYIYKSFKWMSLVIKEWTFQKTKFLLRMLMVKDMKSNFSKKGIKKKNP